MEFLYFLAIGAAAGWIAGQLMKGRGFGMLGNIVVGIIGAYLGGFLLGELGVSIGASELVNQLVTAVLGAVVLLFLAGLIRKGS
ncbi:MAG: GlsB/YeaQ/YmgE family stress response membrane protein [Planctomycetes bacterium]|nr:GlsB/YeaQ/YmgE family stress response membrane protein [Planctomycetota bacterium]